ncbi:hypothetical protein H257_15723 [Aphanomyces astaci]|uniref:Uncharacterized protein n=1 Tax=Aphanomyces astaci TaxID=112090 RepID=W4FN61_APHAT|nr:hypothetical protein H257_15723 [Aphanomyces astaci]ETV68274.1 hypothetical protein H257_15723 [Aphanomyces astaci]|eukprot:XP_009842217.1 hypothetical protein H257_15723 [Aphanomyces astaci]
MTKKHVSFAATKTVAEFHIAHNPTTVPHVGPSVGLVGPPICISSVPILDEDEVVATQGKKRRALYMEPVRRVVMLRRQGYSMEDIGRICIQADYVKQCRKETALAYLVEKRLLVESKSTDLHVKPNTPGVLV